LYNNEQDFVDEYNVAIEEFQLKAMKICIKHFEIRMNANNNKIATMKEKYINQTDIDSKLKEISDGVARSFEKIFLDKHDKIRTYTPLKLKVLTHGNKESNSIIDEESFNTSNHSVNYKRRRSNNQSFNNSANNTNKKSRKSNNNYNNTYSSNNRNSQDNYNNNYRNNSTPNNNNRQQRQAQHQKTRFQHNSHEQN
jgi:hypothetical protein